MADGLGRLMTTSRIRSCAVVFRDHRLSSVAGACPQFVLDPSGLLHQCARVHDAPMLDHLAVFEPKLIRRPNVDALT